MAERTICEFSAPSNTNVPNGPTTTVGDRNFELKPALINMVQANPFSGKTNEDANAHLQHFLEVCRTFTIRGVTDDAICLRLFLFSLMTCEVCDNVGHSGSDCHETREEARFINNGNNEFCNNKFSNQEWNSRPNFPFNNQNGGNYSNTIELMKV
jgi:hypothetical protein